MTRKTIFLKFFIAAPTVFGEEIFIVENCDLQKAEQLHHSGQGNWWLGTKQLETSEKNFFGIIKEIVEFSFHLVKRLNDGRFEWEVGQEHQCSWVVTSGNPSVAVVDFFRQWEAPRFRSWRNWPNANGPMLGIRAKGSHFIQFSKNRNILHFDIRTQANYWQADLRIVGNIEELGNWNPEKGLRAEWSFLKDCYVATIQFGSEGLQSFEFKLGVFDKSAGFIWEAGDNRVCPDCEKGSNMTVDLWGVDLQGGRGIEQ